MYKKLISDFIDTHKSEMTEHLANLINIPSVRSKSKPQMPYGENNFKAQKYIQNLIESMGLETENFENRITIASINKKETKLGILSHLDVVDVNAENWHTNPFEATVKNNMIYGRGAYDDKGSAIAALYALYALNELKIPLKYGVKLYFGSDEECGSSDLKCYLKQNTLPQHIFTPDSHFPVGISESGLIRLSGKTSYKSDNVISAKSGSQANIIPDNAIVKIKNTSKISIVKILSSINNIQYDISEQDSVFTVKIYGKSAHASRPDSGVNAALAALKLLAAVDDGLFSELYNLFPENKLYGEGFGFSKEKLTLSFTVMNYENGQFEFQTDSRVALTESSSNAAKVIIEKLPSETEILRLNEPHSVPSSSYIVQTLMSVYKAHTGRCDEPYGMSGLSYAHGIPNAVVFGARLPDDGSGGAHGSDECFNLDTMTQAAKMFADAIIRICNESNQLN